MVRVLPFALLGVGWTMNTLLQVVLMAMCLCWFSGCAASKSSDTAAIQAQLTAAYQEREETLAPDSAIGDDVNQALPADQNRQHTPVPGLGIADKLVEAPAVDQNR